MAEAVACANAASRLQLSTCLGTHSAFERVIGWKDYTRGFMQCGYWFDVGGGVEAVAVLQAHAVKYRRLRWTCTCVCV